MRFMLMAAMASLVFTACTTTRETRLYDALGGAPGVAKLVDAISAEYRDDARIGFLFEDTDQDYFKARLREQICAISDGGCEYTGLSMEEAHSGMDLSEAQFNDFVDASRRAMTKAGFAIGVQNRLLARLAPMRGEVIHQ
ncbi:MAG TPA: group 1 truncated hemoglobin [Patescibacteria group bacterium]|nr:group 1 truncated hemoglobin [Patescibacteria group bacterium]